MRHVSILDLKGKQRKRWVASRKQAYRKILRDPGATASQKEDARCKIATASGDGPSR
jgi:hypothetical protein